MSENIELSEEEKKELSKEESKQKYKYLMKYRVSENCTSLIEEGKQAGEKLLKAIQDEFKDREKAELVYTEANKLNAYINFFSGLSQNIDDSEGGKIMKEELDKQIQNGLSHLYNKVEIGFDAPMFTKLDMLKNERNINVTLEQKFDEIINSFAPQNEEAPDLHPYENK